MSAVGKRKGEELPRDDPPDPAGTMESDVVDRGEAPEESEVAEASGKQNCAREDGDEEWVRVVERRERERRALAGGRRVAAHNRRHSRGKRKGKCKLTFSLRHNSLRTGNSMVSCCGRSEGHVLTRGRRAR